MADSFLRGGLFARCIIGAVFVVAICANLNVGAREWKAREGSFKIEAEFVQIKDGKVYLERATDGSVIPVPVEKLSFDDYDYLQTITDTKVRNYLRDNPLPLRGLVAFIERDRSDQVHGLDFSAQGDLLAVAGQDGLTLYSTRDWRKKGFLKAKYSFDFRFCKFSPDGKRILASNVSGKITTYFISNGRLSERGVYSNIHKRNLTGAAFSPDGKSVLTGDSSGNLIYWNWESGEIIHRLRRDETGSGVGQTCYINPKGTQAIGVSGKSIVLHDLVSGKPIQKLPCAPTSSYKVAIASSGRVFCVSDYNTTHIMDVRTGNILGAIKEARSRPIQFSPSGKFLAVGSARSWTEIYSIPGLKLLGKFRTPSLSTVIAISAHDRYLAVAYREELHVFKMPETSN